MIFILALYASDRLGFKTLHWILDKATALAPVALVLLLLPELRQGLESFAKLGLWPSRLTTSVIRTGIRTVDDIVSSCFEMASARMGAIIILERDHPMDDIAGNGVMINAQVSSPLLTSLFFDGNPLHDGAVLLRGDKVLAAACRLPLSENESINRKMHMRHRAAAGATESSDCLAVVVSEERGQISVSVEGRLIPISEPGELRDFLFKELGLQSSSNRPRKSRKPKQKVGA